MGLSSNQARFLSLTARQIDLEQRMQQICQRRLRLSSQMQRAAQNYNDQTSDRRVFLNTANSYSSVALGAKGPLTHDILTDNNAYELLTPQNLYDNGLHLFMDGALLNVFDNGTVKRRTENVMPLDQNTIGNLNVGDWYSPSGSNLSYRITNKTLNPNPYNITEPADGAFTTPAPGETFIQGTENTISGLTGTINTSTQYTDWTSTGGADQNPATGFTTQTFTRQGYYDTPAIDIAAPSAGTSGDKVNETYSGEQLGLVDPAIVNGDWGPVVGTLIPNLAAGTGTETFIRQCSTQIPFSVAVVAPSSSIPIEDASVTVGTKTTSVPQIGTANTTPVVTADWSESGASSTDPDTGIVTQNYARTCSVENVASTGFIAPITQLTPAEIAAAQAGGATIINNKTEFINLVTGINNSTIDTTGKTYILNANIDLTNQPFAAGAIIKNFKGTFNGNGYTISNANMTTDGNVGNVGLFGLIHDGATVKNLAIDNFNISSTADSVNPLLNAWDSIGILAGASIGNIDNVAVRNSNINLGEGYELVGGLVGELGAYYTKTAVTYKSATITNSSADVDITANRSYFLGGFVGNSRTNNTTNTISKSYAVGSITMGDSVGTHDIAGFATSSNIGSGGTVINNSYSTVNVATGTCSGNIGAFIVGITSGTISSSYTTGNATYNNGLIAAGFLGTAGGFATIAASNFYKNNAVEGVNESSAAVDANLHPQPTGSWDSNIWNKSGALPVFNSYKTTTTWTETKTVTSPASHKTVEWDETKTIINGPLSHSKTTWDETLTKTDNPGTNHLYQADEYETLDISSEELDTNLRSGEIQLARHADAMTQNVVKYEFIKNAPENFEYVDWRTQPIISDDLYEANDAEAQTMYDKAIRDVNSQDKQLELEQNNVETEYKAITSEKESVNKILDTNVKASFKYFG